MGHKKRPDKDLHMEASDPFRSPTELMGTEGSMRRIFVVHFNCPLCGLEHSCEMYLTLEARNEDEMMEKALQTLSRDDVKVNSLAPFAKEYHQQEGDYLERAMAYARQGVRHPFRVNSVAMTDEESYTCELCQLKFETIGAWRRHDGRDPMSGNKLASEQGVALCQNGR